MARTRVEMNRRGVDELLRAREMHAALRSPAEAIAARARATAPVDTGAYRASIHVEADTTDRAVERVVASVPYAGVVEAKTGNLARAIASEGG